MNNILKFDHNKNQKTKKGKVINMEDLLKEVIPAEVSKYYPSAPSFSHTYFDEQDLLKHIFSRISHYKGVSFDQIIKTLVLKNQLDTNLVSAKELLSLQKPKEPSDQKTIIVNYVPSNINYNKLQLNIPKNAKEQISFTCDRAFIVKTYNLGNLSATHLVLVSPKMQMFGYISLFDIQNKVIEFLWTKWLICGRHPKLVHIANIDTSDVSRVHCLLAINQKGDLNIVDLLSKNGTSLMTEENFTRFKKSGHPVPHHKKATELVAQTLSWEASSQSLDKFYHKVPPGQLMDKWNNNDQDKNLMINLSSSVIEIERVDLSETKKIVFSAIVHINKDDSIGAFNLK